MRYYELAQEAEEGTPESEEIVRTLEQAGYKQLGSGADATVWMKDVGTVIKIIMPDIDLPMTDATEIFYKFYDFVSKNQQYENLPKFLKIDGKPYTTFQIGNKEYVQVAMEQLYPIDEYGIEGDIVNVLSDSASKRHSWGKTLENLRDPANYLGSTNEAETIAFIEKLSDEQLRKLEILYKLMAVLYHTGSINKFGWDLHTGNVMKRKDGTLVIIDPWFSYMGSR